VEGIMGKQGYGRVEEEEEEEGEENVVKVRKV
jgi:hypothetical protein